ncbi:MAG: fructosamine kinase family protein [Gallionella sp.]|nr:fructosamine kinase family protein [Gallionella sp.]
MSPELLSHLSTVIHEATLRPFEVRTATPVGGGCINQAHRLGGRDGRDFFVKLNDAHHHQMFVAEAAGLEAIAATHTVRVPQPVTHGRCGAQSFLVLEYLDLQGRGNVAQLGEQLAAMHRCTSLPLSCSEGVGGRVDASRFGFPHDNFLGTTPQPNGWTDGWIAFWRERRLGHQLKLAAKNGYGGDMQRSGERLMDALPAFFDGYAPQPSLLHGDLWGGNHGYLADGTPVIFDPAIYYGDRECDLAMTELFGGYGADFYAAYRASYPLDAGYAVRRELYNLYHILNHANLFGGSYAGQAERSMRALIAEA